MIALGAFMAGLILGGIVGSYVACQCYMWVGGKFSSAWRQFTISEIDRLIATYKEGKLWQAQSIR